MDAILRAIDYHLPEDTLSNDDLRREFPEWDLDRIKCKTGIIKRRIARPDECASDLAFRAAQRRFARGVCRPEDVDFLILCTQSPDYFLPTTACLLQKQLGLATTIGALDVNLGCSGYIYGLGLAKGLIETGQASNVLLLTADTYSKFIHTTDRSVRTIFGDGAAASLIQASPPGKECSIGPFVYGTDGQGAANLIVRGGGMRHRGASPGDGSPVGPPVQLSMNGPEIFHFTMRQVPECLDRLLERTGRSLDQIDLFVFHQANKYMLEHLREKLRLPREKFFVGMEEFGNTVSASIPIALAPGRRARASQARDSGRPVGFGVGYSWVRPGTMGRCPGGESGCVGEGQ